MVQFAVDSVVKVELDITPDWWSMYGGKALSPKYPAEANRIAKAMMMAIEMFPGAVVEVRVTRSTLALLARVTNDMSMDTLRERGRGMVAKLNELPLGG